MRCNIDILKIYQLETSMQNPTGSHETAAANAYDSLQRLIVMLDLTPGKLVTEADLMEKSGFGRTPVREAVQRLALQGLMEIRPRAGIMVAPLHPGDWLKVTQVRRGVEPILARSAARFSTHENSLPLRDAAIRMEKAIETDDIVSFLDADSLFDKALSAMAENAFAVRAAQSLQIHGRRFWFRYRRVTDQTEIAGHHVAVIDAIIDGDPEKAEEEALRMMALLEVYARSVT
jgi:DNA-binding GntR family transcriptional regulator